MKKEETKKPAKKIKELFVKELARIEGGKGTAGTKTTRTECPQITTLACGEEPGCGNC